MNKKPSLTSNKKQEKLAKNQKLSKALRQNLLRRKAKNKSDS